MMIINRLIYLIFFSLNIGFVIKKSVFLQPQKGDAGIPAAERPEGVSVAQQVEHIPFKDGVLGSSPSWNTKNKGVALQWLLFYVLYDGMTY